MVLEEGGLEGGEVEVAAGVAACVCQYSPSGMGEKRRGCEKERVVYGGREEVWKGGGEGRASPIVKCPPPCVANPSPEASGYRISPCNSAWNSSIPGAAVRTSVVFLKLALLAHIRPLRFRLMHRGLYARGSAPVEGPRLTV